MKQHKLHIIAFALVLMTMFSGCSNPEKYSDTIHERIYTNFHDIKSYTSKCTITIHAQKDHVYEVMMGYDKENETYKLSYDDINIVINEDTAKITKGGVVLKARASDSYMPMFLNSFFKFYYTGEESSIDVSASNSFGTTTLETVLADDDPNASMQKMWIDNKTALPVKSEIYKADKSVYMEIIFKTFKFK